MPWVAGETRHPGHRLIVPRWTADLSCCPTKQQDSRTVCKASNKSRVARSQVVVCRNLRTSTHRYRKSERRGPPEQEVRFDHRASHLSRVHVPLDPQDRSRSADCSCRHTCLSRRSDRSGRSLSNGLFPRRNLGSRYKRVLFPGRSTAPEISRGSRTHLLLKDCCSAHRSRTVLPGPISTPSYPRCLR